MKLRLLRENEFDFLDTDKPVQNGEDDFGEPSIMITLDGSIPEGLHQSGLESIINSTMIKETGMQFDQVTSTNKVGSHFVSTLSSWSRSVTGKLKNLCEKYHAVEMDGVLRLDTGIQNGRVGSVVNFRMRRSAYNYVMNAPVEGM